MVFDISIVTYLFTIKVICCGIYNSENDDKLVSYNIQLFIYMHTILFTICINIAIMWFFDRVNFDTCLTMQRRLVVLALSAQ